MQNNQGPQEVVKASKQVIKLNPNDKLQKLMIALNDIEAKIFESVLDEDVALAKLKIQSGKYLNEAKKLVRSQGMKWEIEVVKIIPKKADGFSIIKKTSRCERMKVASYEGIEKYIHLGWKKLVKIASITNDTNKIDFYKILKRAGYTPEEAQKADINDFSLAIETCYIINKLNDNKINLKPSTVKEAIQRKIVFDKKLIKRLQESKNPEQILKAQTYFDVTSVPNNEPKATEASISEIEETIEKLRKLMSLALTQGPFPKSIPVYMYEDLAHMTTLMYVEGCKHKQNWQETTQVEENETCEFINHLLR